MEVPNQNGEEMQKNSFFEVHNFMCFFSLPFCKPQNSIILDRVLGRKPKVGVQLSDPEIKVVT